VRKPFPDWVEYRPGSIWIYDTTHFSAAGVAATAEAVNLYEAPASGNYWAASCVSGWLIQATVGRAGGWGGLRTNRSG
jgi:hypothetical protein